MNYLKDYNLTDQDLLDIEEKVDEEDIFEISNNKERVQKIIDFLLSIGITNIKDILIFKSEMFYDDVETIKDKLLECDRSMINLINENVFNFDLIGI